MADEGSSASVYTVLLTGANSGLGLGTIRRLCDEFLDTSRSPDSLRIIFTTRDQRKSDYTLRQVERHVRARSDAKGRILFQQELLDLNSLVSVQRLARKLVENGQHIDVMILNAGIGGWTGLNWPKAIYDVLTDWVHSTTWPEFIISARGRKAAPQIASSKGTEQEPPLGEVFCANLFGHYELVHQVMPLLTQRARSRVIWISSIEATPESFSFDDFQGLRTAQPYRSSKRLTDILMLSSGMPAVAPVAGDFYDSAPEKNRPRLYAAHPGICATGIIPLPFGIYRLYDAALYVTRLLGSIWHTCDTYKAATAPVWIALVPEKDLNGIESDGAVRIKWGSSTDIWGRERVEQTEVEGWGYTGVPSLEKTTRGKPRGRRRGAVDATAESREQFIALGARCWEEMERLRKDWEQRLEAAGT